VSQEESEHNEVDGMKKGVARQWSRIVHSTQIAKVKSPSETVNSPVTILNVVSSIL